MSHLKSKWYGPGMFQSALLLCHLDMLAGAVMSAHQGCLSVCCSEATLVRWLVLVWARDLELNEAVSQLVCPDSALIHTVKVEGNHKTIMLTTFSNPEIVSVVPAPFGRKGSKDRSFIHSIYSLKLWLFFSVL